MSECGRPENVTQRAQIACAQWLTACLSFGWEKSDLDWLETLWWRHHDRLGRLVGVAP